jgi:tyrosine-protein kinase Etk/Wzc
MGPIQNIKEFLSWLGRRWQTVALFSVLGALVGVIVAMNTLRVYSSSAVIQVINPIIAVGEDGTTTTAPDVTRRVQIIEQRLMSRENLLDIAERFHLFEGLPLSTVERVGIMRESFRISAIAAAQQGFDRDGSLSALIVTADDDDPERAAAIANYLADSLVSESVSDRQSEALQAVEFFSSEEARLEAGIADLEDEIASYSTENEGFLPDAIAVRRTEQGRLAGTLLELQQEVSARRNELAGQDTGSQRAVTQRRIAQLNDELTQFSQQAEVVSARIDEIQLQLQAAPSVEQQIIAMNRRMEQLQDQLTAAAERRREAQLSARIEVDQQAERFELLERGLVPDFPISQSRKKVAAMGVAGGIILGLLIAYVMEWMKPVMRTASRVERDLQLRPVISIPYAMPTVERRRRNFIWGVGVATLVVGALLMATLLGVF